MKIIFTNQFVVEISDGIKQWRIWTRLAYMSIKNQYRQNILGPFWITANTLVLVLAFSVVYSQILHVALDSHLVYVASGLVCWFFYSTIVQRGCGAFLENHRMILELSLPFSIYIFRLIYQELIVFAHNLIVVALTYIFFSNSLNNNLLLSLLALGLIVINAFFVGFVLAIITARFRDVASTVQAIVQPLMFLTPIIWSVDSFINRPAFVTWNPFFHIIEIWRAPFIGAKASSFSWYFVICFTLFAALTCSILVNRYKHRIAFWL